MNRRDVLMGAAVIAAAAALPLEDEEESHLGDFIGPDAEIFGLPRETRYWTPDPAVPLDEGARSS
jgi:hypothetical protein